MLTGRKRTEALADRLSLSRSNNERAAFPLGQREEAT